MAIQGKRPLVLIVDDERVYADTLALILNRNGCTAVACYSGADALVILHGFVIDILIADVMLGAVSGIDIAVEAKQVHPECTALLISGNLETAELLDSARQRGIVIECLPKPVPPPELMQRIGLLAA